MGAVIPLTRFEPATIRTAWPDEARNFTPWLAENLDLLGEAVGLDLMLEGKEVEVGPFSADILAREGAENRLVLIENQCTQTDHRHLGQILTYAAGLDAAIAIWVTESFREEHRAAIDYLNRFTTEEVAFFGVVVRLFKVGENHVPQFEVVAKPNDWSRGASTARRAVEAGSVAEEWLQYWTAILSELTTTMPKLRHRKPARWRYQNIGTLRSGPGYRINRGISITKEGRLCAYLWISGPRAKDVYDVVLSYSGSLDQDTEHEIIFDRMDSRKSSQIYVLGPGTRTTSNEEFIRQHVTWFAEALPSLTSAIDSYPSDLDEVLSKLVAAQPGEQE